MKPSIKYGIITGIAVGIFAIGFFSVFNWVNAKSGWGMQATTIRGISGLLTIVIQATGIYFSMNTTKTSNGGVLTYGQAFKAGLTVAVMTALITALFGFIYCTIINPGYTSYMINEAHKAMVSSGEPVEQIAKDMVGVKWEYSVTRQVTAALIAQSVVGTMLSLIMAPFIRNKKS
jgi:hypothetical protein